MGFFEVSLETANRFYTWGWRASVLGALITAFGIGFLMWGTRVRDHDFEDNIATLHNRAASSEKLSKELEKGNLTLQGEVEKEKMARLKLEEKLAPRSLNRNQQEILRNKVSLFKNMSIDIFIYGGGSQDALPLAGMIGEALEGAGWTVKVWNTMAPMRWVRGVLVSTRAGADRTIEGPAVQLILTLRELGIDTGGHQQFTETRDPPESGIMGPTWEADKQAPIRMLVGSKP